MSEQSQKESDRVYLSPEQAIAMLPKEGRIHTFRQAGFALIGADWDRSDILDAIQKFKPELSGEQATAMQHGIVLRDDHGYLFIQTAG